MYEYTNFKISNMNKAKQNLTRNQSFIWFFLSRKISGEAEKNIERYL